MPTVELGDICEFLDHRRKPVSEELRTPGPFPYYGANGQQGWINDYIFDETLVLLAEDGGHFGSKTNPIAYKVSGKTWVNNHAHVLRPLNGCDADYLTHVLSFYDVTKLISGTTRLKLTKGNAEMIRIPLPDVSEQRRIAVQMEQADRLRRTRRYALELTDTFLPAAFLELFRGQNSAVDPWPAATPLGEHLEAIEGGVNFNPVGENDPASDWRVLKVSAVSWSDFLAEESKPISPAESFSEKVIVQRGDLIMSRANTVELVGAVVRVRRPPPKVLLPDKLWRLKLRAASQLLPDFLLYALRSGLVRREIQIRASGTSGSMKNISKEDVRELRLPLPPFELQQKFAALVEQVERLRAVQREALRQAEHFFQTLLHRAFSEANSTNNQGRSSGIAQEVT